MIAITMKFALIITLSCIAIYGNCKIIKVCNGDQLHSALSSAAPGDTIRLHDGNYHGSFETNISGTASAPIRLTGSKHAIITGIKYGFWLKADHWVLMGFTVADSQKGIVLEGASHNLIDNVEVHNVTQEGIHFRWGSTDNTLQHSYIHHTGRGTIKDQGYGEGVYIGQASNNWQNGQPDKSDRNKVLHNRIGPEVTAECIDIKEGSCCGLIKGNHFDGHGESGQNYAESHIDVKGDNYTIEGNTGTHPLKHGFEIHHQTKAGIGGCGNTIKGNHCRNLPSGGECVVNFSTDCENYVQN
ncbi:unnamed protein product [Medioppia subpectinata]|uniref:Right handed beta helix domain-containing protein n=1 Tax=Medioppia subpectinata TaxID=1979941 RepID=A0A7R9L5W8_9ACAR|nr:unnamed protein product [Medioppia subpectinata]CAG2114970.1 unnamed protein product [Medioppia subpectinata]